MCEITDKIKLQSIVFKLVRTPRMHVTLFDGLVVLSLAQEVLVPTFKQPSHGFSFRNI